MVTSGKRAEGILRDKGGQIYDNGDLTRVVGTQCNIQMMHHRIHMKPI